MKKIFNKLRLNQQGVTLIEMLVVMGLLAILLVVIATIYTAASDVTLNSKAYSATSFNARYLINRLNFDIARATSVTNPTSFGSPASTLDLNINSSNFDYALSGNNLVLTNSSSNNLNSNDVDVSNLSFTLIGSAQSETVNYSFTLTSVASVHGTPTSSTYTSAQEVGK